jgi:cytochrome P450
MGKATSRLPPDLNVLVLLSDLFDEKDDAKYYNHIIDLWPMSDSVVNLVTPEPTTQAFANHRFPKHSLVRKGMEILTGGPNMLTMSADEWKPWRGVFNPGFSSASINAQIGAVVDRVEVFRSLLVENAGKSAFPLGDLTSRLTADVIVKLTLQVPWFLS